MCIKKSQDVNEPGRYREWYHITLKPYQTHHRSLNLPHPPNPKKKKNQETTPSMISETGIERSDRETQKKKKETDDDLSIFSMRKAQATILE